MVLKSHYLNRYYNCEVYSFVPQQVRALQEYTSLFMSSHKSENKIVIDYNT